MGNKYLTVSDNLLRIPFVRYAVATVTLPALCLAYCFLTAYLFRGNEINDTDCNVTNTIPSVSAVTGIRPQAYLWRISIAIQTTPRFFVGIMYYNYYSNSLPHVHKGQALYKFLVKLCFVLYTLECFCLQAVSSISNKENYPIHERIFVVFMICSIAHMVFGTFLYRWSKYRPMTHLEERSYFWKIVLLVVNCLSTVGLLWFFVQHRFYCIPGAFSFFSVFEYLIAYSNMAYHMTGYLDFHDKCLLAGNIVEPVTNGTTSCEEAHNGHLSSQESTTNNVSPQKSSIPVRNRSSMKTH